MKKNFLRRVSNRILHLIARFGPGLSTVRPFLHRLRGVRIEGTVFIAEEVFLENEYPELIELHDGAQLNFRSMVICHFRGVGKVIIEKNAWVGPGCIVAVQPGKTLTIGEGSLVAAGSVVLRDIPSFTFVGGVPAKPIAKITVPMTVTTPYHVFKEGLVPLPRD